MRSIIHHILNNHISYSYSKTLLVIGFVCAMIASLTSSEDMEGIPWDYSYYHFNAISFLAYLTAFYLIIRNGTPKWSIKWQNFTLFVVLCALSTIGDELALNGPDVTTQDFSRIFVTVLIFAFFRQKKNGRWKIFGHK